jgi:hypothetical protein
MEQLCVFPGIPSLFQQLLLGLTPYLPIPPASSKPFRHLIFTKCVNPIWLHFHFFTQLTV